MGLDLSLPIGLMFSIIGALLTVYGLITKNNSEMYEHSLGININLVWGIVLLIFGVFMLAISKLGKKDKKN